MRDWKPSEVGNYGLTRAAEEVKEGTLNTGRDLVLFNGKWPDDFIDAFKPPMPSRAININQRDPKKPITVKPSASRVTSLEVCL